MQRESRGRSQVKRNKGRSSKLRHRKKAKAKAWVAFGGNNNGGRRILAKLATRQSEGGRVQASDAIQDLRYAGSW